MNEKDFQASTDDYLCSQWGDGNYPLKLLQKLWGIVKDISVGEFQYALEELTMKSTRPPSIGQIKAACMPAIHRALQERRRQRLELLPPCDYCAKSGWIIAHPPEDEWIELAFICSFCRAAETLGITLSKRAVRWDTSFAQKFKIKRLSEYREVVVALNPELPKIGEVPF